MTDEADLSSPVLAEGLAALEPERRAYQRVVADLGVGIERQVVPGQRDVGVEQDPQSLPHGGRDRAGMEVPQQTVMGYHQLRALIGRPGEQLALVEHTGDHELDVVRAGHLQPLGP